MLIRRPTQDSFLGQPVPWTTLRAALLKAPRCSVNFLAWMTEPVMGGQGLHSSPLLQGRTVSTSRALPAHF